MWNRLGSGCIALVAVAGIGSAATLSSADRQFMTMAARTNMTEAHEGQMAENQGSSAQVKDFAQTLVQDHTKSYGELVQLASKEGVTIPTGINTGKMASIQQLKRLKGATFDRQFAKDEVADHRRVLAEFKRESTRGADPAVKQWASSQIPVLEKHLELAEKAEKAGK